MTKKEMQYKRFIKRKSWCVIDGELIWQDKKYYGMSGMNWLKEQFDLRDLEAAKVIRGGVYSDRIAIYRGYDYMTVDMSKMPKDVLQYLVDYYCEEHDVFEVRVVNGLHFKEKGVLWEPIEDLGLFSRSTIED